MSSESTKRSSRLKTLLSRIMNFPVGNRSSRKIRGRNNRKSRKFMGLLNLPGPKSARPRSDWESEEVSKYLDHIWYGTGEEEYEEVLVILKDYMEDKVDTPYALQALCNVFHENPSRIQDFRPLVRRGHEFQLSDDFHDTHCIRISTDTDTVRAAFGLMKSPEVKPKLLAGASKKILRLLDKAVTSTDYQTAVFTLQGGDAMQAMELMQKLLDDSKYWTSVMAVPVDHRHDIQRLLVKLSQRCDKLPDSLFLKGVTTNYEMERIGGFSNIYRGQYRGQTIALKRLRCFYSMTEPQVDELNKAFTREALVWRQLRHPNVVPFLGIDNGNFNGSTCIVMPWLEAGNIRDYIEGLNPKPSIGQLNRLLLQIARGLDFLHGSQIVHADLRGGNVIIDNEGNARLADFGLSVFADGASNSYYSMRGGVAFWLAPELIDCIGFQTSGRPTAASDVYAYACVCIEVYTNSRPFAPLKDYQASQEILHGQRPERPSSLNGEPMPDNVWAVVNSCWHQKASQRPNMAAVIDRLVDAGIV